MYKLTMNTPEKELKYIKSHILYYENRIHNESIDKESSSTDVELLQEGLDKYKQKKIDLTKLHPEILICIT